MSTRRDQDYHREPNTLTYKSNDQTCECSQKNDAKYAEQLPFVMYILEKDETDFGKLQTYFMV